MKNELNNKKGILALKEEYVERLRLIHEILNMNEESFNSKIYGMKKDPETERKFYVFKRKLYTRIVEDLEELLK